MIDGPPPLPHWLNWSNADSTQQPPPPPPPPPRLNWPNGTPSHSYYVFIVYALPPPPTTKHLLPPLIFTLRPPRFSWVCFKICILRNARFIFHCRLTWLKRKVAELGLKRRGQLETSLQQLVEAIKVFRFYSCHVLTTIYPCPLSD